MEFLFLLVASVLVAVGQCNFTTDFMAAHAGRHFSLETRYRCTERALIFSTRARGPSIRALQTLFTLSSLNGLNQKRAVRLMDSIGDAHNPEFNRLRNCSVDDKGHVLPMMFIIKGWLDAISHDFVRQLITVHNSDITDVDKNNYVHLAARTGDSYMISEVLTLLAGLHQDTSVLMEQYNAFGQRPIDIATDLVAQRRAAPDVVQTLKNTYKTNSFLKETTGTTLPFAVTNDVPQHQQQLAVMTGGGGTTGMAHAGMQPALGSGGVMTDNAYVDTHPVLGGGDVLGSGGGVLGGGGMPMRSVTA